MRRRDVLVAAGAASVGCAVGPEVPAPEPPERFAGLVGLCDGAVPCGDDVRRAAAERIVTGLEAAGKSALVIEAGASMRWLTGVRWGLSERPLLFVLPVRGRPLWVGPAFEEARIHEGAGEGADVRTWQEHESPYDVVAGALGERQLDGPVEVDPFVRLFVAQGLGRHLQVDGGGQVLTSVRRVKQPAELALMRQANEATKVALRAASEHIGEGMDDPAVRAVIREALETAGLTSVWVLGLCGPNAAFPHGTKHSHRLGPSDLVLVDCGGSLHGYQSDITRTWAAAGTPGDEVRRAFDAVLAAQTAGLKRFRAGVRCGEVDAAARASLTAAGFGEGYARFTHRLGHGIGVQGHEEPYLVQGSDVVLAPGMTTSVEPGVYVPGAYGIRIEDIAAVTRGEPDIFGPRVQSLEAPFG